MTGQVMIEKQSSEGQLNISTLAPGVYTLRMQSSDRIGIGKFIKN
jgi:hypothetical protein